MKSRLLNSNQIRDLTGLSRSTLRREERAGRFPSRVRITSNRVGWDESEVLVWLDAKLKNRVVFNDRHRAGLLSKGGS